MKKIILLTLLVVGALTSCDDDKYKELNREKKNPSDVPGETLFANGMRDMFDMMVNISVNENVFRLYSQYWAQTTYPDESAYNQVTREIPDNMWSNAYRDAIKDMTEGRDKLVALPDPTLTDGQNANKLAVIDINIAYTYSFLLESFGDVIFTEALDADNLTPAYDDGQTTYDAIITMLDGAIAVLEANAGEGSITSNQDPVYGGDDAGWLMFANSLKLRMALNYYDANASKANTMVAQAMASGLIMSSGDDATITYFAGPPNTNPIHADLVLSGRKDFIVANTLVDKLNELGDNRMFDYAANPVDFTYDVNASDTKIDTDLATNSFVIYSDTGVEWALAGTTILAVDSALRSPLVYQGGTYGTANSHSGNSHIGDIMYEADEPGCIFSATETMFLLAEWAARNGDMAGAETYYNNAITSSFADWGSSGAAAYLANPDVAFTTADGGSGDWKQIIGEQAWLGLFNRGFEGWTTWRRLDFAGFNPPPGMVAADIPTRMLFPAREANLNGANLDAAIANIGGDTKTTKLWWDKQ